MPGLHPAAPFLPLTTKLLSAGRSTAYLSTVEHTNPGFTGLEESQVCPLAISLQAWGSSQGAKEMGLQEGTLRLMFPML